MNRSVNLVARSLGLAWVGAVAFGIYPSSGRAEQLLQAIAYGVAWLGMIGWALIDYSPQGARYRKRGLPVILGVIAAAMGGRALGIQIQAARSVLTDYGDIDRAVELLTAAHRMAGEGLTETRRAVHALRSDTLPLAEELAMVTSTYSERYHVSVSLDSEGTPRPVPAEATVGLLRVAQESLVNAAKHGAGQPVTVRLDFDAAWVRLTVRNEVDAVAPRAVELSTVNAGYGLTGMRERLRLLGGTLEAGRDGAGWVVTAQVPLSTAN